MTSTVARRLVGIVAALTLVAAMAVPAAAVDGDNYVSLANAKRASVGLPPVSLSSAVDQVTMERANQMARTDTFTHDLAYVESRLEALGVCFTSYGEIIAWEKGYPTYDPARTMEQWWASKVHHDIIVGNYNAAGGSHTTSVSGRIYSAMVFVKLCSASAPPGGGTTTSIQRMAGSDRYATAAAISKVRFAAGASTVFLATGASFPDALAGSPAAAKVKGPILLTARDSLPGPTATELARLNPSKIVVLGGTGVVTDRVVSQARGHAATVVRWAGANRYETAARISANSFATGASVAYVATAKTFPDALSGGAVAGRVGGPILLVDAASVPSATAQELVRLKPDRIVVLGGTGVISDSVRSALDRYTTGSVTRLWGSDRFATSVQISRSVFGTAGSNAAFIATGTSFPDGLAGGPVAALVPGPLLLVTSTQLPGVTKTELQRLGPDTVFVLGGAGAVSDGVVRAIDAALP